MDEANLSSLLTRLKAQASVLELQGDDIECLSDPDDFFQELLLGLRTAQHHVTIASLYFGTGTGREAEFAAALAAAAHDTARPRLRIGILLDALRSTRPTRGSGGAALTSTAEMLATTLLDGQEQGGSSSSSNSDGGDRVVVALFHTPALRGLLKRVLPPRVSEVVGVQHAKVYCFDDTVIISGANISSTYLSTRQDRYLVLRRSPQLAALLQQVVQTVGSFSYQLQPLPAKAAAAQRGAAAAAATAADVVGSARNGGQRSGIRRRRDVLLEMLQRRQLPWQRSTAASPLRPHHLQRHHLQRQQRYRLAPCPAGLDPVRQAQLFTAAFRRALLQLLVPCDAWDSVLDWSVLEAQGDAQAQGPLAAGATGPARTAAASSSSSSDAQCHEQAGARAGTAPWAGAAAVEAEAAQQGDEGAPLQKARLPQTQPPDTWIVPMVQAGFAGLRQEERCTLGLLAWATQHQQGQAQGHRQDQAPGQVQPGSDSAVVLQLASPYLNLARPYERFLSRQAAAADLELITASPEANGFFGSNGVSGYIPLAYSLLEQRTWRRLTRQQQRLGHGGTGGPPSGTSGAPGAAWHARQLQWRQRWADRRRVLGGASGAHASEAAGPAGGGSASGGAAGSTASRRLLEYCRSGWEFHAKGLWISLPAAKPPAGCTAQLASQPHDPPHEQQQRAAGSPDPALEPASSSAEPAGAAGQQQRLPAVTAVGSSNFGFRSLHRDLELQFVLVTTNGRLQQALGREVAALKAHCAEVAGDAHFQAPGRRGGAVARVAVRLLRGLL